MSAIGVHRRFHHNFKGIGRGSWWLGVLVVKRQVIMIKRWLIRALFILPLMLTVSGWAWSAIRNSDAMYSTGTTFLTLYSCQGVFGWEYYDETSVPFTGLAFQSLPQAKIRPWPRDDSINLYHLGFGVRRTTLTGRGWAVPYWLPTAIFSGLLILIWRASRPKPGVETAFPVETAGEKSA